MSLNFSKLHSVIIEVVVMIFVLFSPFAVPRFTPVNYLHYPYYIQQLIYAFSFVPSLIIFFIFVPPKSIIQAFRRYGITPILAKDVFVGIGYTVIGIILLFLLYLTVLRPLGFGGKFSSELGVRYAQTRFDFAFLALNIIVVAFFNEVIFRAYLYYRSSQLIHSKFLQGVFLLSVYTLYHILFFSRGFSWTLVVISGISVVAFLRSKKLIRPIISNSLIQLVLFFPAVFLRF